jgi:hypothetical protein
VTVRHLAACVAIFLAASARADEAPDARVERNDNSLTRGTLVAVDGETVTLTTTDGRQALPIAKVRRIVREQSRPAAAPTVKVVLVDGGELSGIDVIQDRGSIILTAAEGRIEIPAARVRRIAWLAAGESAPAWTEALPPKPGSDLLVVRREGVPEFVECAVASISADTVTVVLDGEKIPVKRAKVAGIEWLRERTEPPGGIAVLVFGGRLQAGSVAWSPKGLVIDDSLRLPAASLRTIDYAAGRTVPLATIEPERVDVEPFFGELGTVPGLAAFFAPRTLVADADNDSAVLLVRPRTVVTWRVPADSRRFHATASRDVPAAAPTQVDMVLSVDDKEIVRQRIDATTAGQPVAIDMDVTGCRRLTLTIDFVPGDIGCGVRLTGAAFER